MSEATELLEHMEHASHSGHGGGEHGHAKGPGKAIGITMALLGVMLAFCAALVGSERTELIKATVDQSNKWSLYQSESMKYRVMEADVEMLKALTPSQAELGKFNERLATVKRAGGKADDEDTTELKEAIHVATTELADVLTPDKEDEDRLGGLRDKYQHDMAEAKEDAEVYDAVIDGHHEAAEWYERAQLCAEIGIVIASVALLMSSTAVWIVSLLFGLSGAGIIGWTFLHTRAELQIAEQKIEDAAKQSAAIEKDDEDDDKPGTAPSGSAAAKPAEHGDKTEKSDKPGEKPAEKPATKPE